jgi:hypothetical protein
VSTEFSLSELSGVFSEIGAQLVAQDHPEGVLQLLTEQAVHRVPGAEYAGITLGREGQQFATVAATDEVVQRTDAIQYELGTGPCIDAVLEQGTFKAADLRSDPRWPEFGRRAIELTGIRSMLSMRLFLEADRGLIAGMNIYSRAPKAFDETSETIALLLATHGALAVARANAQEKARNLLNALQTSREIGIALGIVMAVHKVPREQAFDLLRVVSQHTHRKISDVAAEVASTGALPQVPLRRSN